MTLLGAGSPSGGGGNPVNIVASGGTITYSGGRKIHTFLNSTQSLDIFYVPDSADIDYLIVAGGGGGKIGDMGAGGAGGGGLLTGSITVSAVTYPITVGAGGPATNTVGVGGTNGSNSVFNGLTAIGGGGGGYSTQAGVAGGSGGGGGNTGGVPTSGGAGTVGQGNYGGQGTDAFGMGGGGGAGAVGANGSGGFTGIGGNGGIGLLSSISGTPTYYAGGGGGGGNTTGGTGGLGGGGNGGSGTGFPTNGTANTGGGAGSQKGGAVGTGGNGGSGIVIVSYEWTGPEEDYGYLLETVSANIANVPAMDGATLVEYAGVLQLINGWNPTEFNPYDSSTLRFTTSDGNTFTAQADGGYDRIHGNGIGVRNDGKIWMWGWADNGNFIVYTYDSTNGWVEINTDTSGHQLASYCLHKDYLYRVGGQSDAGASPTMYTDVERSSDGINWTVIGSTPTSYAGAASICSDGTNLYFGGGGRYRSGGTSDNFNTSIWVSDDDGATWYVHSSLIANQQTLWPTIHYSTTFSKLFYLTGSNGTINNTGLYYYRNSLWILMDSPSARHLTPMCDFDGAVYIITGNMHNDSYKITENIL